MKPELSIIITSYKNPAILELCINSLKENIKGLEYEIIVADTMTEEATYDLMREKFPQVKFIPNKINTGFGVLVNQGIEAARGDYLFIINSDIIVKDENGIPALLDYLKKDETVGMAGPQLINFDNSVQPSCFRYYTPWTILYRRTFLKRFSFAKKHLSFFLMEGQVANDQPNFVDWIMGSAMMVSREAMEKVGGMDTKNFFMYFEDVDWCWRFWQKGYKVVYLPMAKVFHYHGKQSASQNVLGAVLMNKYTRIHIASAIKFFIKHFGKKNPRLTNLQT